MSSKRRLKDSIFTIVLSLMMMVMLVPFLGEAAYADSGTESITVGDNMIWGSYTGPQAVEADGKVFWGYVTPGRTMGVACYDKTTGTVTKKVLNTSANTTTNPFGDYNAVSVALTEDKHIVCAYATDSSAQKNIHFCISDEPLSIGSFSTDIALKNANYPNHIQLVETGGKFYIFFRVTQKGTWAFVKSEDGGNTWTPYSTTSEVYGRNIIKNTGMAYYCRFMPTTNQNLIRVLMCSDSSGSDHSIRMGFFNTADENLYNSDAVTNLGTKDVLHDSFDEIQAADSGRSQQILDVTVTAPDKPRFIYASFTAGQSDGTYKLYDGGTTYDICDAGEPLSGDCQLGASFRGANDIIAIRNAEGSDIIESYLFDGAEVSKTDTLYTCDATGGIRAARPIVDNNGKYLLWHEGTYSSTSSFNTSAKLKEFSSKIAPDITLDKNTFYYNGEVQKPTATLGDLVEGTDYDLVWSNAESKDAGTYTVTAQLKGTYAGQADKTAEYRILPDPLLMENNTNEFKINEAINVIANTEGNLDWVGLFKKDDNLAEKPDNYYWYYVKDHKNVAFNLLDGNRGKRTDFEPGEYKVVLLENDDYNVIKSIDITINPILPGSISIDKENREYMYGDPIKVTATSDYPSGYVGFYPYDGALDKDLLAHYKLSDAESDTVDIFHDDIVSDKDKLADLPDGRYKVILFTDGWDIDRRESGSLCIESFYIYNTYRLDGFTWEEKDGKMNAVANFTGGIPISIDAVVTSKTTNATCSAPGETIYTATVDEAAVKNAGIHYTAAEAPFTDTKTVVIEKLNHDYQDVPDSSKPATCEEPGKKADKECSFCKDYIKGEDIPALGHNLGEWKEAKPATCTEAGNNEYWTCSECGKYFSDAEGTNEIEKDSWIISAKGHTAGAAVHEKEVEATCTQEGSYDEVVYCEVCKTEISRVPKTTDKAAHRLIEVDAKEATTDAVGNIKYWTCSVCEKYFSDSEGKTETTQEEIIIPKKEEQKPDNPQPTDPTEEEKAVAEAKDTVDKAVAAAEAIDKDKYTKESVDNLQAAIDAAKALANDPNAKAEDLKAAAAKVEEAKAALKEKTPGSDPNQKGTDGTAVGPGASEAAAEQEITNMKSDTDPAGSVFAKLRLKSSKQTSTSITLNWTKNSKAVKYVIYGNKCGKSTKPQKLATAGKSTTKKTFKNVAGKKVKKGTYYKFIVVALDKNNNVVSSSKLIHVATKGGKVGNYKSVSVSKTIVNNAKKLKKGKTLKLKAKAVAQSSKLTVKSHVKLRYESTNKKIATVSKSGVIKGKKKGTCYVYAYSQNGVYKKIKVTVK